jgi:hypothetical protein
MGRAEGRADRVRQRVCSECLTRDGGGVEQCQPDERPFEPRSICSDDPIAVERQANESVLGTTG